MRTPSAIVPRITSEDPPPTSTTAISPSTGWPSAFVAPRKASRPSSSSLSTSTSKPAASSIAAATFLRFGASLMAAVATIRICSAPSSSARRTCVATTSQTSSILSAVIAPSFLRSPLLIRV